MPDRPRSMPALARFGLTEERAEHDLRAAGWWRETGLVAGSEPILVALSRRPDPDLALRGLDRIREADPDGWPELAEVLRTDHRVRGRLCAVLGTSTALADFLVAQPEQWRRLAGNAGSGDLVVRGDFTEAPLPRVGADPHGDPPGTPTGARAALRGAEAIRALRLGYRGLLLEIAAEDLGHLVEPGLPQPSYEMVAAALSDLAEAALRAALAVPAAELAGNIPADEPLDCSLAVIAMGKCGGRELNYVSDVDVVFAGDGDIAKATRLAAGMMRVAGE